MKCISIGWWWWRWWCWARFICVSSFEILFSLEVFENKCLIRIQFTTMPCRNGIFVLHSVERFGCSDSTYLHAHWSVNIHRICCLNLSWISRTRIHTNIFHSYQRLFWNFTKSPSFSCFFPFYFCHSTNNLAFCS